uniref:Vacuolar protein sorting-associated protein 33A n=1 Tax=Panagrellus redivivus TaxID=6233 RepID=A0A7E4W2T6_PANRE
MTKASFSSIVVNMDQKVLLNVLDRLEGTKTIVWDRYLMSLINSIISYQTLKEHQVVSHMKIDSLIQTEGQVVFRTDHILYIVPPTVAATEELIKSHLERVHTKDQRRHRVYFVPEVNFAHRDRLSKALPWMANNIYDLPLRWFPTDHPDFASLNLMSVAPVMLMYEDWNELYKCAKAIRQIETSMGVLPRIVYKGYWAQQVIKSVERLRKSEPDTTSQNIQSVDEIVLIDRWLDPVTPLVMQQTFSGALDEIYGIDVLQSVKFDTATFYDEKKIPKELKDRPQFDHHLNDDIYGDLCDVVHHDVPSKIQMFLREQMEEEQKYRSLESIAKIRECVNAVAEVVKRKETISGHLRVLELIHHELSLHHRSMYRLCELDILDNKYGDKPIPHIENLLIDGDSLPSALRLIALQSQMTNGLKISTLQHYRRLVTQSFGLESLSWFIRLQIAGLIRCNDKSDKIVSPYKPIDFERLKKKFKLFVDDPSTDPMAKHYVGYVPLLTRILQEGDSNGYREWSALEPASEQAAKPKPANAPKSRLLFIIGGTTRAEMGIIRENFDFKQCCTSATITGDTLIAAFK